MGKNEKGYSYDNSSRFGILNGLVSFILMLFLFNLFLLANTSAYALIFASFISGVSAMLVMDQKTLLVTNTKGDTVGTYTGAISGIVLTVLYYLITGLSIFNDFFNQIGATEAKYGIIIMFIFTVCVAYLICSMIGMAGGYIGAKIRKSVGKPLI